MKIGKIWFFNFPTCPFTTPSSRLVPGRCICLHRRESQPRQDQCPPQEDGEDPSSKEVYLRGKRCDSCHQGSWWLRPWRWRRHPLLVPGDRHMLPPSGGKWRRWRLGLLWCFWLPCYLCLQCIQLQCIIAIMLFIDLLYSLTLNNVALKIKAIVILGVDRLSIKVNFLEVFLAWLIL